jgi:SulP family sulfate permease
VEKGILLAVFLSLVAHTRHGYRPRNTVVVSTEDGKWLALPTTSRAQTVPGLLVYRFSHSMYYANSAQLSEQVQSLVQKAAPPLTQLCIDFAAVDDVDFSAAATLHTLLDFLDQQGVRLVLAAVADEVRAELDRSNITERLDPDAYFASIGDVVDAYGS